MFGRASGGANGGESSRFLRVNRLPGHMTHAALESVLLRYGEIRSLELCDGRGSAIVEFSNVNSAVRARQLLNGKVAGGRRILCNFVKDVSTQNSREVDLSTVFVRPLHFDQDHDPNDMAAYEKLFSTVGPIKKLTYNRKKDYEKFVEFYSPEHAKLAVLHMNGLCLNGIPLELQFANHTPKTIYTNSTDSVAPSVLPTADPWEQARLHFGVSACTLHTCHTADSAAMCPMPNTFVPPYWVLDIEAIMEDAESADKSLPEKADPAQMIKDADQETLSSLSWCDDEDMGEADSPCRRVAWLSDPSESDGPSTHSIAAPSWLLNAK